jgi:hypothetical protein
LQGDLSQVRTLAELILDDENSYELTCSSTDLGATGTNYATQLQTIQDDIDAQNSTTACYADDDSYCISVVLLSSGLTNGYYCIDSNGVAVATSASCSSANTGCNGQGL